MLRRKATEQEYLGMVKAEGFGKQTTNPSQEERQRGKIGKNQRWEDGV